MDAPHPAMATDTITQPAPDLNSPIFEDYKLFCRDIFPDLIAKHTKDGKLPPFEYKSGKGLLLTSAGPNMPISSSGLALDAKAWANQPRNYIQEWFKLHGDEAMAKLLEAHTIESKYMDLSDPGVLDSLEDKVPFYTAGQWWMAVRPSAQFAKRPGDPILGRLHPIEEPAGKVRVVAICDYWTQTALWPVHVHLFSLLRLLHKNDATFDQDGTVKRYYERGLSPHWSYDLKSATDLIPLELYKQVLAPLLVAKGETYEQGVERANLWSAILTDRDFFLPTSGDDDSPLQSVRYGTGQPMGALSSWASMALVHHSLVQFSNWRGTRKPRWFLDYLILGDDVDIATDVRVANSYVECCKAFSIIIGLQKSLKSSRNFFEFANRRFHPLGDLSPISLREELSSITWSTRREFAKRIVSRVGALQTSSSVLRRTLTAAQWTSLAPEMSGLRASSLLRLVHFCSDNPFSSIDEKEITVSRILVWLLNILTPEDTTLINQILLDKSLIEELDESLVQYFIATLKEELEKRLSAESLATQFFRPSDFPMDRVSDAWRLKGLPGTPPKDWGEWGRRTAPLKLRGALDRGPSCPYPAPSSMADVISPLTPTTYDYLEFCINKVNTEQALAVTRVKMRLDRLLKPVAKKTAAFAGDVSKAKPPVITLSQVVKLWIELFTNCNYIPPFDGNRSLSYRLNAHDMQQRVDSPTVWKSRNAIRVREEGVFGPMKETISFIAGHLGIQVPNVPFFNRGQRGKQWLKALRSAIKLYDSVQPFLVKIQVGVLYAQRLEGNSNGRYWLRSYTGGNDLAVGSSGFGHLGGLTHGPIRALSFVLL
jgi:hypothetical protein